MHAYMHACMRTCTGVPIIIRSGVVPRVLQAGEGTGYSVPGYSVAGYGRSDDGAADEIAISPAISTTAPTGSQSRLPSRHLIVHRSDEDEFIVYTGYLAPKYVHACMHACTHLASSTPSESSHLAYPLLPITYSPLPTPYSRHFLLPRCHEHIDLTCIRVGAMGTSGAHRPHMHACIRV